MTAREPYEATSRSTEGVDTRAVMPTKREGVSFLGCGCLTIILNLILLAIVVAIIVLVAKAVWG